MTRPEEQEAAFVPPPGWMMMGVGDGTGALFVHGPRDAIKALQARIDVAMADAVRLDRLEELALDGEVTLGVELDGGVHMTIFTVGEEGRAHREKNTIRDAIDAELTGKPTQAVPDATALHAPVKPAEPPAPPSPERLLEIARATGLREYMHAVPPPAARALLARFFEAASKPDANGIPVAPKAQGVSEEPELQRNRDWMPLRWWRDEIRRQQPGVAFIRMSLLNEEQAGANHGGQSLERLRLRGGMSPNEALAIVRRVPCRVSMNEQQAFEALIAHVQRLEGAPA